MKKIILSEEQSLQLGKLLSEESYQMPVPKKVNGPYCISPEKVNIVRKHLDKNFKKGTYETIGNDGKPKTFKIVAMVGQNGDILKNMYMSQLYDYLVDEFQNMFTDKMERELFMKQTMNDWFDNKISIFGQLSKNYLSESISNDEVNKKANEADTNPTDAQKKAGNYKMGHFSVGGMRISIENPAGSYRRYKKPDGTEGKIKMKNHYGYFTSTTGNGKDGDAVDVFIGPHIENVKYIYVIDQDVNGEFDESKVMLGFKSIDEAKTAYFNNYSADWKGFRKITCVPLHIFKKWLYRDHKQQKPFSEYVLIQKHKIKNNN